MTHFPSAAGSGAAPLSAANTGTSLDSAGGASPGPFSRVSEDRAIAECRRMGERHVWCEIDGAPMSIAEARAAYDAGTHTLAQGRVGGRMRLYAIPLRERAVIAEHLKFSAIRMWMR